MGVDTPVIERCHRCDDEMNTDDLGGYFRGRPACMTCVNFMFPVPPSDASDNDPL
jgi:hypothetical protein